MSATFEVLKLEIAKHLVAIEELLPAEYRLTLVARHTAMPDADIIISVDENLGAVELAIAKLIEGT